MFANLLSEQEALIFSEYVKRILIPFQADRPKHVVCLWTAVRKLQIQQQIRNICLFNMNRHYDLMISNDCYRMKSKLLIDCDICLITETSLQPIWEISWILQRTVISIGISESHNEVFTSANGSCGTWRFLLEQVGQFSCKKSRIGCETHHVVVLFGRGVWAVYLMYRFLFVVSKRLFLPYKIYLCGWRKNVS